MAPRANANKRLPACSHPLQELASQIAGVSRAPKMAPNHAVAAWPRLRYARANAPVAQLDRALPSEGRGQGFESLRARHFPILPIRAGLLSSSPRDGPDPKIRR